MTGDPDMDGTPRHDSPEPRHVVAAMASAVERVRSMAKTVFRGDADLFAETAESGWPN
jgi:hypothetical protein